MNIITYATPFFLLAILLELAWGWFRKNNTYRLNDSVNSLSLGMLRTLSQIMFIGIGAVVFAKVENEWAIFSFDKSLALHWIVAILVYDFCYYWFHRISHERQFSRQRFERSHFPPPGVFRFGLGEAMIFAPARSSKQ